MSRKDDLDASINLYDAKRIKLEIIKILRVISQKSKALNQFSAGIEIISQLLLLSNSLISFLEEIGFIDLFLSDTYNKFGEEYKLIFETYNELCKAVDKTGVVF